MSDAWPETRERVTDGLVHDFNNLVTGIHALSEAMRAHPEAPLALQDSLELIQSNALKARLIVHQLVALHRAKTGSRSYHNLNGLITEATELMHKSIPHSVKIETALAPESLPVFLDAVAFKQILMQLTFALARALAKGGKLRFETSRGRDLPAPVVAGSPPLNVPWVCLKVGASPTARATTTPVVSAPAQFPNWDFGEIRSFAESHGGRVATPASPMEGEPLYLWLPEADFTEARRGEVRAR